MKKAINTVTISGRVYDKSKLEIKTVKNQSSPNFGKEFIQGSLSIAVDEEGLNVIDVYYTYVTATTAKGDTNRTYGALEKIINTKSSWLEKEVGKENAVMVKCDTALALNDFVAADGSMVAQKRNEGGFVTIINELPAEEERNTFSVDMVITSVVPTEIDPEKNINERFITLRGATFNFRNALLPMEFTVKNPQGIKFFEDTDISNAEPMFTKVWGRINSLTTYVTATEESGFGEARVKTYPRKVKEWIVTGTSRYPYEFGDEKVLTSEELVKAMQDREVHLAEVKKNNEEYKASKATSNIANAFTAAATAVTSKPVGAVGFNF